MSALRPLNVELPLLVALTDWLRRDNAAHADAPGRPSLEIAQDTAQVTLAARLMAQAFIHNRDKGWLAWLPPAEIERIRDGDTRSAEHRIARVIAYLCDAAQFGGGLLLLESADGADGRVVRGASLWGLPPARPRAEPGWHLVFFGVPAALRSYGPLRAIAASRAADALVRASHSAMRAADIPPRCVYGQMGCVLPAYQGLRVSSRMGAPFRALADRFGLVYRIESSSPETNDERVFARFGFEKLGEHRFGASVFNSVGPYTINLLARRPATLSR